MRLYHGSFDRALVISPTVSGRGYSFGALFFTRTYAAARNYGDYVYQCELTCDVFTNEDIPYAENAEDALLEVMTERGIHADHFDLCYRAVTETMDGLDRDEWASILGMDEDDAGWEAQAMRIAFAKKLGFHAVGMDDEAGSIAVLPEHVTLTPAVEEDDDA